MKLFSLYLLSIVLLVTGCKADIATEPALDHGQQTISGENGGSDNEPSDLDANGVNTDSGVAAPGNEQGANDMASDQINGATPVDDTVPSDASDQLVNDGQSPDDDADASSAQDNSVDGTESGSVDSSVEIITLLSPVDGELINVELITLEFSASSSGWLYIGSAPGGNDIADVQISDVEMTVEVPLNGNTLYFTVWTIVGQEWHKQEYQFNTQIVEQVVEQKPAELTAPVVGDVLENDHFFVEIDELSANYLYIGTMRGGRDVYQEKLTNQITEVQLLLPDSISNPDEVTLYFTLWTEINGSWHQREYEFLYKVASVDTIGSRDTADGEVTPDPADQVTIHQADIMILFTAEAAKNDDPEVWATGAIEYINQVLENSRANLRFRLAYAGLAPSAILESQQSDSLLKRFRTNDQVNALKAQYGADMVSLIVEDTNVCGLGYRSWVNMDTFRYQSTNYHYFLIQKWCGYKTFSHEAGHNMGLGHSRAEGEDDSDQYWARGYGVYGEFSTLMGYSFNYGLGSGASLPVYSNPELQNFCEGQACGIAKDQWDGADAASFINAIARSLEELVPSELAPAPTN